MGICSGYRCCKRYVWEQETIVKSRNLWAHPKTNHPLAQREEMEVTEQWKNLNTKSPPNKGFDTIVFPDKINLTPAKKLLIPSKKKTNQSNFLNMKKTFLLKPHIP